MKRRWIALGIGISVFAVAAMGATNVLQVFQGGIGRGTVGTAGQAMVANDAGNGFDFVTLVMGDGGVFVASVGVSAPITTTGGVTPTLGCATCVTTATAVGGDVAGTVPAETVIKIQGVPVADAGVAAGYVLTYATDGGDYVPLPPATSGTVTSIATTAPLAGGPITTTGTLTCNVASGSQPGCLASADWTTFNNKQAALTLPLSAANGGTGLTSLSMGGDLTGTYPNPTLATVITAGGPTGSASVVPVITWDAKGRTTVVTTATITPAAIGAAATGLDAGAWVAIDGGQLNTTGSGSMLGSYTPIGAPKLRKVSCELGAAGVVGIGSATAIVVKIRDITGSSDLCTSLTMMTCNTTTATAADCNATTTAGHTYELQITSDGGCATPAQFLVCNVGTQQP